jgi:thiamine pyrophosphokinase
MRALVLAHGQLVARRDLDAAWPGWSDAIELVVAADGGAHLAASLGLAIDRWVGDGDSTEPELERRLRDSGIAMDRASPDKDESDTELALVAALDAGATDVTIVGGLGGRRFDHALANVLLLAHPRLVGLTARLLGDETRVTLVDGPADASFEGRTGDLVSLLPLGGDVEGVTTDGLRYPLRGEPLRAGPARGLSNVRTDPGARIRLRSGRLLVIETPANLGP